MSCIWISVFKIPKHGKVRPQILPLIVVNKPRSALVLVPGVAVRASDSV